MLLRGIETEGCIDSGFRGQADDDKLVRSRDEVLCFERPAVAKVAYLGNGVGNVKPAAIIGNLAFRIGYPEVADRLVSLAVMALDLALETVGLGIILAIEGFADQGNSRCGLAADRVADVDMAGSLVRLPGPECGFI